jgi:hypothetical protein
MTTYAAFVTAISGLTITSVNRTLDSTPGSIGAADLPFQFVRLPEGDFAPSPASCLETGKIRSIDLVVCIEPAGLEMASQNFDDTVAMMDYIETALDTYSNANDHLVFEYDIVTSGAAGVDVGGASYWAVIATVTITG